MAWALHQSIAGTVAGQILALTFAISAAHGARPIGGVKKKTQPNSLNVILDQ